MIAEAGRIVEKAEQTGRRGLRGGGAGLQQPRPSRGGPWRRDPTAPRTRPPSLTHPRGWPATPLRSRPATDDGSSGPGPEAGGPLPAGPECPLVDAHPVGCRAARVPAAGPSRARTRVVVHNRHPMLGREHCRQQVGDAHRSMPTGVSQHALRVARALPVTVVGRQVLVSPRLGQRPDLTTQPARAENDRRGGAGQTAARTPTDGSPSRKPRSRYWTMPGHGHGSRLSRSTRRPSGR